MTGTWGAFGKWLGEFSLIERRYFPIDGGAGAVLFAHLPDADHRLRPAHTPRHADLLVIVAPVSEAFLPVIAEAFHCAPPSCRLAVVAHRASGAREPAFSLTARLEDYLPVTYRFDGSLTEPAASAGVAAAVRPEASREPSSPVLQIGPVTELLVPLRTAEEREIATEDAVVSIGPIQQATAGPLQLLLTTDGEQVVRAEIRSGFAARGIERLLREASWRDGVSHAELLDPLAPAAGRLAYVTALECLLGLTVGPGARRAREVLLRAERAYSHLIWLTRFSDLMAYDALTAKARHLGSMVGREMPSPAGIVPGGWDADASPPLSKPETFRRLADQVSRVAKQLSEDRLFALRTRGLATISRQQARKAGASGPVLAASERGTGDARTRALTRMMNAAADLREAASLLGEARESSTWVPGPSLMPAAGTADGSVEGPRGVITLTLESAGGDRPADILWVRPSAAHLTLLPGLLVGCTLPDALVATASLDLSMAEVDG